jgi:hypothetical protein
MDLVNMIDISYVMEIVNMIAISLAITFARINIAGQKSFISFLSIGSYSAINDISILFPFHQEINGNIL